MIGIWAKSGALDMVDGSFRYFPILGIFAIRNCERSVFCLQCFDGHVLDCHFGRPVIWLDCCLVVILGVSWFDKAWRFSSSQGKLVNYTQLTQYYINRIFQMGTMASLHSTTHSLAGSRPTTPHSTVSTIPVG